MSIVCLRKLNPWGICCSEQSEHIAPSCREPEMHIRPKIRFPYGHGLTIDSIRLIAGLVENIMHGRGHGLPLDYSASYEEFFVGDLCTRLFNYDCLQLFNRWRTLVRHRQYNQRMYCF